MRLLEGVQLRHSELPLNGDMQIIDLSHGTLCIMQYMDIFNQFSSQELEKTHSVLREFLVVARANDRVITLKKGLLEDLLIYFRKISAFLHSEWQSSVMLQELATINFMFTTFQEIQKNQEKEAEISPRVTTLITGLI